MRRLSACEVLAVTLAVSFSLSLVSATFAGEDAKAARAAHREKAKANLESRKEAIEAKKEAAKAKREEIKENRSEAREKAIDNREGNQAKRIQHGINKGYLTADEVKTLQAQQDSIAALETSIQADGKVTPVEFKQIQTELNKASRCIWAEKHDTDGKQMATYRLGKNVFANSSLTSQLSDPSLSASAAKALLKDFRRLTELKRTLATGDLSDAQRAQLQSEYDALLNTYFETR